jgi:hypothetical protein
MKDELKIHFDYADDGSICFIELEALEIFAKVVDTCMGPSDYSDGPWRSCESS